MYAVHALKFARRFAKYNRKSKPLFDRFADSVGLGRVGDVNVFDVPRYLGYTGAAAGGASMAVLGMKRARQSYAGRKRSAGRKYSVTKRRKMTMPRQALPYRMAAVAGRRSGAALKHPKSFSRNYMKARTNLTRRKRPIQPKLNVPFEVERLQGIKQEVPDRNPDDPGPSYPGFFDIRTNDPNGVGNCLVGVYIAALNTVHQTGEGASAADAMYRLQIQDDGTATFQPQSCQLSNGGVGTAQFQFEDRRFRDSNALYPRAQPAWYDIRLKLYGARKQSVTYDIMLCKFYRRELCPDELGLTAGLPDQQRRTAFWQNMVRSSTTNSILPTQFNVQKNVRVIKRKRITLAASSSDDLETVPENVDLKWFVRDGRVLNYTDGSQVLSADTTVVASTGWATNDAAVVNGQITNRPAPTSRMFLIIRATDMTRTVSLDDMDDSPSFDLMIRRKTFYYL